MIRFGTEIGGSKALSFEMIKDDVYFKWHIVTGGNVLSPSN